MIIVASTWGLLQWFIYPPGQISPLRPTRAHKALEGILGSLRSIECSQSCEGPSKSLRFFPRRFFTLPLIPVFRNNLKSVASAQGLLQRFIYPQGQIKPSRPKAHKVPQGILRSLRNLQDPSEAYRAFWGLYNIFHCVFSPRVPEIWTNTKCFCARPFRFVYLPSQINPFQACYNPQGP